jgi:ABC-type polysaccharide/polyol phosphate export permease
VHHRGVPPSGPPTGQLGARQRAISEIQNLWDYRGLVRLLVVRDLTVRYKRSTLGVWWTVLNPLLAMVILWIVFGQIFRFSVPGIPYIVYLLSGIIFFTFFSQGVYAAGSAIVNNSSILTKVAVPPEVFSVSAAAAAAANFIISLVPLLMIQLATGTGIPWTVVLVPIPILALLLLIAGIDSSWLRPPCTSTTSSTSRTSSSHCLAT